MMMTPSSPLQIPFRISFLCERLSLPPSLPLIAIRNLLTLRTHAEHGRDLGRAVGRAAVPCLCKCIAPRRNAVRK